MKLEQFEREQRMRAPLKPVEISQSLSLRPGPHVFIVHDHEADTIRYMTITDDGRTIPVEEW